MSNTLILFTSQFPYGKSETFLENEIPYLAKAFRQVYIITLNKATSVREVPANITVLDIGEDFDKHYSLLGSLMYLSPTTFNTLVQEYQEGSRKKVPKRAMISYMLRVNYKAYLLETLLKENNISTNAVFYSYWFEEWATVLSIFKSKGFECSYHARTHGFDLYEERSEFGFIPFRELQLKGVKTVSAVSQAGYNYLINRYPQYTHKFFLHRLGVQDNGIGIFDLNNDFTLVSCSNVIPLKRVNLIVEILTNIKQSIKWIHFGDGVQLDEVKKLALNLPENILVEFKGRVANQEIVQFYKTNQVNLFITTTETEGGCPVSIQEAISFGIPVIGTAVGGVPEIVNSETGVLIDKDFDARDVARFIEDFLQSNKNSIMFREQVRRFWAEKFMAEVNFKRYIDDVLLS